GLEEQELRDDEVREVVTDRVAEDDDPIAQEPRVDVVGPFAASGLLDDDRNEIGLHRAGRVLEATEGCNGVTFPGQGVPPPPAAWDWQQTMTASAPARARARALRAAPRALPDDRRSHARARVPGARVPRSRRSHRRRRRRRR